jgi:hypothetical protein
VLVSDVLPHIGSSARVLIGAAIPGTDDVVRNVDPQNVSINGFQVVELCFTPGPLALEDLILSSRPIVNGHLNLDVFLRWSAGLLLRGRHLLWRDRYEDLRLR